MILFSLYTRGEKEFLPDQKCLNVPDERVSQKKQLLYLYGEIYIFMP